MGKTALVTGGSRGIGRAICVKLAEQGYDIVFNYQSGAEAAKETEALCTEKGVKVLSVQADVSVSADCDRLIKEAAALNDGKIAVLVNNAGITRDNLIIALKDEDMDRVIDVNLKGSFYMMRGVAKLMLRAKAGRIINMSSVVGIMGNAGQVNYSATKAAVIGMTKSLAKEIASRHVTVNAVAPGYVETDMTAAMTEDAKKKIADNIPLKTLGQPEDIANAVAFLASDGAAYITGQVLCVDGGLAI